MSFVPSYLFARLLIRGGEKIIETRAPALSVFFLSSGTISACTKIVRRRFCRVREYFPPSNVPEECCHAAGLVLRGRRVGAAGTHAMVCGIEQICTLPSLESPWSWPFCSCRVKPLVQFLQPGERKRMEDAASLVSMEFARKRALHALTIISTGLRDWS